MTQFANYALYYGKCLIKINDRRHAKPLKYPSFVVTVPVVLQEVLYRTEFEYYVKSCLVYK